MWTCSHCGEKIEDQFDGCWNCGWTKAGEAPPADLEYYFSMQELHTRILFTQETSLNEKCGGMEQVSNLHFNFRINIFYARDAIRYPMRSEAVLYMSICTVSP